MLKCVSNGLNSLWYRKKQSKTNRQASVCKSLYSQIALISSIGQKLTSSLNLDNIHDNNYTEVNGLIKAIAASDACR